jgi:hypothetical protein
MATFLLIEISKGWIQTRDPFDQNRQIDAQKFPLP